LFKSLIGEQLSGPVDQGFFIPNVPFPQWKIPFTTPILNSNEDFLFHRAIDPAQNRNLWSSADDQRERMLNLLRELMREEGAPPEQFVRLGLL
jgi:hypothetical protein